MSQQGQTGGAPGYSALAADLIDRATSAEQHWRTPGAERLGMTTAVTSACLRAHAAALKRIVERLRGWPGRSTVGPDACQAAVDIAVHSDHDLAFQQTMLHLLQRAVESGEATSAQLAHLHDRLLANAGQPQLYGTQHWYRPDGSLESHPVIDPDQLDIRRAGVGLPPYAERARRLREHHGPPASSRLPVAPETDDPGRTAAA